MRFPLAVLRQSAAFAFVLALALALVPREALAAGPNDKEATSLAEAAMQEDYMATEFEAAQKKLKKALKACSKKRCSNQVIARVHRDLGVVRIIGLQQIEQGTKSLARAVRADPSIQLDPNFTTPEVEKAFNEAGGIAESGEEEACDPEDPGCVTLEESEPEPPPKPVKKAPPPAAKPGGRNLLSATFQLDFLWISSTTGACTTSGEYTCYGVDGNPYVGPIWEDFGNEIDGGIRLTTQRLLLGFDRYYGERILFGARLGYAFGGGPAPVGGSGFLPLHVEARAAYFLTASPVLYARPYALLGFGVAEVDAHVSVAYFESEQGYQMGQQGTLDAWRKTGLGFLSPGVGTLVPIDGNGSVVAELRVLVMLGTSATGASFTLGYAYGLEWL